MVIDYDDSSRVVVSGFI